MGHLKFKMKNIETAFYVVVMLFCLLVAIVGIVFPITVLFLIGAK